MTYPTDVTESTDETGRQILRYKNKQLMMKQETEDKLRQWHRDHDIIQHQGISRTEKYVGQSYWWPGWRRSVHDAVRSCDACVIGKRLTMKIQQRPLTVPESKFDMVSMDYFGFGEKDYPSNADSKVS